MNVIVYRVLLQHLKYCEPKIRKQSQWQSQLQ